MRLRTTKRGAKEEGGKDKSMHTYLWTIIFWFKFSQAVDLLVLDPSELGDPFQEALRTQHLPVHSPGPLLDDLGGTGGVLTENWHWS